MVIHQGWDLVFPRGSVETPVSDSTGVISGNWDVDMPSQTVIGDYLIVVMQTNADSVGVPSGWTTLEQHDATFVTVATTWVFGRVATSTHAGGGIATWDVSNTTPATDCAVVWAFANVDPAKVVTAVGAEFQTSGAKTTPSVSITVPSLMMHAVACRQDSATAVDFTYASGTKTEANNFAAVAYTASGAPADDMVYTMGSQTGISITPTAAPTTAFPFQIGLGARAADPQAVMTSAISRASRW